jgi:hypothetical protein
MDEVSRLSPRRPVLLPEKGAEAGEDTALLSDLTELLMDLLVEAQRLTSLLRPTRRLQRMLEALAAVLWPAARPVAGAQPLLSR